MEYQNVIKVLQNKTLKVVENVNEHLQSEKNIKNDLNDLKEMLENYKIFVVQWERLQRLLAEENNTQSWSLMANIQRMKLIDKEKAKISQHFAYLKEKVNNVRWKMGQLCPTCRSVFNEVLQFIDKIEKDENIVKPIEKCPQNRNKKSSVDQTKSQVRRDKSVQVDIPIEKQTGLRTKVGQKVVKLAKHLDIVLM